MFISFYICLSCLGIHFDTLSLLNADADGMMQRWKRVFCLHCLHRWCAAPFGVEWVVNEMLTMFIGSRWRVVAGFTCSRYVEICSLAGDRVRCLFQSLSWISALRGGFNQLSRRAVVAAAAESFRFWFWRHVNGGDAWSTKLKCQNFTKSNSCILVCRIARGWSRAL